jgi:hypothetical protein
MAFARHLAAFPSQTSYAAPRSDSQRADRRLRRTRRGKPPPYRDEPDLHLGYPLVAHGDLPCALKSERSPTRKGHTSPPRPHHRRRLIDGPAGGPDLRNRGVASRPGAPGKTREMNPTPLRWQVPSGGGCFVREGGRAPAVSGMRRNPEAEIHPLSPDLRGRYRIDMQERFPSLGRPPGPPALSSLRALD